MGGKEREGEGGGGEKKGKERGGENFKKYNEIPNWQGN